MKKKTHQGNEAHGDGNNDLFPLPSLPHSVSSPSLIDMRAFLERQRGERYRAFIVHGPARKGKTTFARKLADVSGGAYIDVLATVAADPALAADVDLLDANFLKRLALEAAAQGAGVIVVDEFDFLMPVWNGDLALLVEIARKLSVSDTQAVIGFVMHTVSALETTTLENSKHQSRVLRLDEIQAL